MLSAGKARNGYRQDSRILTIVCILPRNLCNGITDLVANCTIWLSRESFQQFLTNDDGLILC